MRRIDNSDEEEEQDKEKIANILFESMAWFHWKCAASNTEFRFTASDVDDDGSTRRQEDDAMDHEVDGSDQVGSDEEQQEEVEMEDYDDDDDLDDFIVDHSKRKKATNLNEV